MAATQSRGFLNLPPNDIMTRQKAETTRIAKDQQAAISEKLRRNGLPVPEFTFLELIGKGSYGRVFKAMDIKHDRLVALKVIDVDSQDYKVNTVAKDNGIQETLHEIRVLQQLKDSKAKNINPFFDAFQIHSQLWIVNEYCPGGSVRTLMRGTDNKLEEKYILPIARELAIGLKAIHDAGIIHRDIKAANVMIHEKGMVQIIDFGVAGVLQTSIDKRSTVIGTPHWMAPELHKNAPPEGLSYGTEVDVWAYGCTLYEIATGLPPFPHTAPGRMLGMSLTRDPPRLKKPAFSEGLSDLVAFVLAASPANRPSMSGVLQNAYIQDTETSHPTVSLVDLVKKYYQWERSGGQRQSLFIQAGAPAAEFPEDVSAAEEEWNFSTTANFEQQFSKQGRSPSFAPDLSTGLNSDHTIGAFSTQATEESLNSYFQDDTPLTSPTFASTMSAEPERDDQPTFENATYNNELTMDERVKRGGKHLQGLFDESEEPYMYGVKDNSSTQEAAQSPRPNAGRVKSDLPLRDETESSSLMRKEVDVVDIHKSKSTVPNIDLANVGTIKANRMIRAMGTGSQDEDSDDQNYGGFNEPKRATMGWTFPQVSSETHTEPKRDTMAWSFPKAANNDDTDNEDTPMFREPKRDTRAFVFPQMDQMEQTSPTTLPIRPALKHAITAPVGKFARSESGMLDLDAMLEDVTPVDRPAIRAALSSDDEGSTRPPSTDSDEEIGATVDNPKASEATARRLGKLPAAYKSSGDEEDDDEPSTEDKFFGLHTARTKPSSFTPPEQTLPPKPSQQTSADENASRDNILKQFGFPDIAPPSAAAMAQDAPPEVVAAEFERLLGGWMQSLESMKLMSRAAAANAANGGNVRYGNGDRKGSGNGNGQGRKGSNSR